MRDTLAKLYPGRWGALLVPLCGPECGCASPGKVPHHTGWDRQARHRYETFTAEQTARWLEILAARLERGQNIGLAIPPWSVAFDVDTDMEGEDVTEGSFRPTTELACDEIRNELDGYPTQKSGKRIGTQRPGEIVFVDDVASVDPAFVQGTSPGVHILAATPIPEPSATHYAGIPITVRKTWQQIVAAPSRHVSGARYEWLDELPFDPEALPEIDPTRLEYRSRRTSLRFSWEGEDWRYQLAEAWRASLLDPEQTFRAGERHEAMLRCAWELAVCGVPEAEIEAELMAFATHRCAGMTGKRAQVLVKEVRDLARDAVREYARREEME